MEIKDLLRTSVERHASDLHIMPGVKPLLRINGVLGEAKGLPTLSPEEAQELIYNGLTEEQKNEFETNLILETALYIPDVGNFRLSVLKQINGVAAVYRVIPITVPTFEQLGLPSTLKTLADLSHGLILVTGPTGSGKSTTLAALIDYINTTKTHHIITIEDPVEFVHNNKLSYFNQLQVGRDTPDFSTALKASLRQDPDVIMLGELRDLETMRLALVAAETGHLVFATLHACSAPLAINRFADVFPMEEKEHVRTLLSETLQGVICQTLVKKTNGGRTAAFEVMYVTPPIRHFIRADMPAHIESTMQMSAGKGMCTLEQFLGTMVKKQIISPLVASIAIASRGPFKEVEMNKKE